MNFEAELAGVAEQYRSEGYAVTLHPRGDQLPPFAAAFHVDLLATNGAKQVLVQVKENLEDLKKDPDTPRMAEVINEQPGWRFDLFVLGRNSDPEKIGPDAVEPPLERILRNLDQVEYLARTGEAESSFLIAWAALEAAMRRAARTAGITVKTFSPQFLLGTLYSNGLLERHEYDELNKHLRVRNAVAHGLEVPPLDVAIPLYVANAARNLLAWDGKEQPA